MPGSYQTITAVKNAGYLAIPNDLVAPSLKTVKAALMGGLFFTLSIGAGVTILALLSTWIWKYVCFRKPYLAIPLLLPWIAFSIFVNLKGPAVLPSLYFTVVPILVALLALKLTPDTLGPFRVGLELFSPGHPPAAGCILADPVQSRHVQQYPGPAAAEQSARHRVQQCLLPLHPLSGRGFQIPQPENDQNLPRGWYQRPFLAENRCWPIWPTRTISCSGC